MKGCVFFCKQKKAYEMRISDWSSDVCSSDLLSDFFSAIRKDGRISITHIGIYAALLQYWKDQNFNNPMTAFSSDIMIIAKISSCATYRSEERRVGKEWVSTCRSRWSR